MNIFWFRRDLRLDDNAPLYAALRAGDVLPVFIFDTCILDALPDRRDRRVSFIHHRLRGIKRKLERHRGSLRVLHGTPAEAFESLLAEHPVEKVYAGADYEPYARERDDAVAALLARHGAELILVKDHVIFDHTEVLKADGGAYTVYTPYMRAWKKAWHDTAPGSFPSEGKLNRLHVREPAPMPGLAELGFEDTGDAIPDAVLDPAVIAAYHRHRDFPARDATTRAGPHLRFGTVSIRRAAAMAADLNETWLNQLIWREFFIQVLARHPHTATRSFRPRYDDIPWNEDEEDFRRWREGRTGFPLVDAGMRQLNDSGYMHNRVRMLTANFLTKLLLTDWRAGEAYFAGKLLDYEMANNVGGWQWACGSGCDAAPYFRIFNPDTQLRKFDPDLEYVRRWVPEYGTRGYPPPMIGYREARQRALAVYKAALQA